MASNCRENLVKACKEYCDNTTLHGYKYLVLPHRKLWERLMWVLVLTAAIIATVYLFNILLTDYYKTPTVTTMESYKYPLKNVPFPGVALCNINKISRKQAMKLSIELQEVTNYTLETIFDAVRYFGRLYDFEVEDIEKINLLNRILDQTNPSLNTPEDLMSILQRLAPSCEEMVLRCLWQGFEVNCSSILETHRTMDGFCCIFNNANTLANIEDIGCNKKSDNIQEDHKSTFYPNGAGLIMGLSMVVTANLEDYYYPFFSAEGLSVKIFNSFDYPDSSSGGLSEGFLSLGQEVFMHISATTVSAVPELRETSKESVMNVKGV